MSYPQETFANTTILPDSLLYQRREAVAANTLFYQLDVLKKTGRYDCFNLKWHPVYSQEPEVWPVPNHLFWDSDVAKWIEGACYLLHNHPDPKIDASIDELVNMIRSAQQPDGYFNLHYTVVEPGKRFTNLRDMHELYNAGHMIEAALAHQHLYENDRLMEPILKYVDLLHSTFGPGKNQVHGYPGHPEIELALIRLYHRTCNPKHLELAQYFVTERGNPIGVCGEHFFDAELRQRGHDPNKRPSYHTEIGGCKWYYSAHLPIIEQPTIQGHSVRAMYLLAAATDLIYQTTPRTMHQQPEMREAVYRLWDNMVDCKMYSTGGIGSIKQYEGFGVDYFLPEGTDEGGCYAETCASIGVMMLAQRILQYDLDHKYGDVMELELYNAVLTAMSSDGKSFTYVNQLASSDTDLCKRSDWFTVACCPPNMLRLLGQIGGYICNDRTQDSMHVIDVHLYIPSVHTFELDGERNALTQRTNYPWEGDVEFCLNAELPSSANLQLRLRIPSFASHNWQINPPIPLAQLLVRNGYLYLPPSYLRANAKFTLSLPLHPRLISPHPYATNAGTLTLARGPIIYCVEDVDNPWVTDHFKSTQISADCLDKIVQRHVRDDATGDKYVALRVKNSASVLDTSKVKSRKGGLPFVEATCESHQTESTTNGVKGMANGHVNGINGHKHESGRGFRMLEELNFVPFYFRANRGGRGHSRVGLRRWV